MLWFRFVVLAAGVALVAVGAGMAYLPAGFIVAGAALAAGALFFDSGDRP